MLLIPAIDLKDGHCVRLKQGDMAQATTFSEAPADNAQKRCSPHPGDQPERRRQRRDDEGTGRGTYVPDALPPPQEPPPAAHTWTALNNTPKRQHRSTQEHFPISATPLRMTGRNISYLR